jgi:hypothetical protein
MPTVQDTMDGAITRGASSAGTGAGGNAARGAATNAQGGTNAALAEIFGPGAGEQYGATGATRVNEGVLAASSQNMTPRVIFAQTPGAQQIVTPAFMQGMPGTDNGPFGQQIMGAGWETAPNLGVPGDYGPAQAAGALAMNNNAAGVATTGNNAAGAEHQPPRRANTVMAALEKAMKKSKGSVQRQKQEFGRQKELGEPKWKEFKEETLQHGVYIKPMAVVQKGSPVVKILHSIAKFADADGPEELSGKIFGFYGERTKYGPPAPLILPDKNAWEWNKKAKFVPGAIAWKTWLGQVGNEKKLWAPDAAAAVEKELPRMLQLRRGWQYTRWRHRGRRGNYMNSSMKSQWKRSPN